jgi:hypothetical protein
VQGYDHNTRDAAADVRWRVTTATGVQFACLVQVDGTGIEVRLTTSQEQLVCARVVPSLDDAAKVARGWLHAVVSDSGLSELFPQHGTVH